MGKDDKTGLLSPEVTDEVAKLLTGIPADIKMSDLTPEKAQATFGQGSPAYDPWYILRAADAPRWGVGPTTASKILHRKRPHLIPIWEVVIGKRSPGTSG